MNNSRTILRMISTLFMALVMTMSMIPAFAGEAFADDGAQAGASTQPAAEAQADAAEQPAADAQVSGGSDKTANFHAVITSSKDEWSDGVTAIYDVKYKLDQRSVSEGDYIIVNIPSEVVSQVDLAVSPQHFSKQEDLGNGRYKLTFAKNAESALSGSFTMNLTMHNDSDSTKSGSLVIGEASKEITVYPVSNTKGSGTFTDAINKDATGNDDIKFGDYDYSDGRGNNAKQIGVIQSDSDGNFYFRLFINRKKGSLSNIRVTDTLPGGMHFDSTMKPEVVYWYKDSTKEVDSSKYSVSTSNGTLDFSYNGELSGDTIMVKYYVTVDDVKTAKYTNIAEISYTENGNEYSEHSGYVLTGSKYSAVNGEKMVNKTVITDAPEDQHVMYSFKFWNNKVIEKGTIDFVDQLNSYLKYESAVSSDYFDIVQDEQDPHKIYITNKKDIPADTTLYARFFVDMSDVPEGSIVSNTAGGNTVYTVKKASLDLTGLKKLNGKAPGEKNIFKFDLTDESGKLIETKENNDKGEIKFSALTYGSSDTGKPFTYYVKEQTGNNAAIEYDDTKYKIEVTVSKKTDEKGNQKIVATPKITNTKTNQSVDSIVFNNQEKEKTPEKPEVTQKKISVSGTKTWKNVPAGEKVPDITIDLYRDGTKVDSTVLKNGKMNYSFADLDKYNLEDGHEYKYTVKEEAVDGYTSEQNGFDFTNTKIDRTPAHPDSHDEKPAVVPAEMKLDALKTIDSKAPGENAFKFELKDENGSVLQTSANDSEGKISFSPITYDEKDCGKTFTYTVSEQQEESKLYKFDNRVYTVKVTPTLNSSTGRITAEPQITLDGSSVDQIAFNNTTIKKDDSKVTPDGGDKKPIDGGKDKTHTNGKSGKHVSPNGGSKVHSKTGSTRTVKASEVKTPAAKNIPRTGDTSEAFIYSAAGIAAVTLAALMLVIRKRRRADR